MLKLMIVDDEKIVIDVLKSTVNWEEFEIEIVGTATNGKDALKIIENNQPDIVLTDIRMPVINGLELIKETKKKGLDIIFVIISGYQEFEYAKKAIELQAIDYLVKPVEVEEIISVIHRAKEKRKQELLKKQAELDIQHYQSQLEEKNVLDSILGGTNKKVEFFQECYCLKVACFGFTNSIQWKTSLEKNERHIKQLLADIFKEKGYKVNSYVVEDCLIVIYGNPNNPYSDDYLIQSVYIEIEKLLDLKPLVGISDYQTSANHIHQLYKQAKAAFEIGIFLNQTFTYHDVEQKYSQIGNDIFEKIKSFFQDNDVNLHQINSLVEEVIRYAKEKSLPAEQTKYVSYKLLSTFCDYISNAYNIERNKLVAINHPYNEGLNKLRSIDEIKSWLFKNVKLVTTFINENRVSYNDKLIKGVKGYLENNFEQPISLNELAQMYHINPAYLSHLFSKKVGISIIEYMTLVRISKAKDLLISSNLKVSEISYQVGYDNQRYFNQVFKKKVGTTPGQYRSKHMIGQ